MVVYSHDMTVHGVKFQSLVLPNGFIINHEEQWKGRIHDCTMLQESGLLN